MANLSQGAPGFVDKSGAQKEQISENTSTVDGRQTRVVLYSDGSRKVWINGVLDHDVPVFSDVEKAAAPVETTPSVPVPNVAELEAAAKAAAAAIAEKAAEEAAAALAVVEKLAEELRLDEEAAAKAVTTDPGVAAVVAEAKAVTEFVEATVDEQTPVVEGFIAQVEEKVEEVVAKVEETIDALEFKSIAELKDLAGKLGIDLGKATKKDDIITTITDASGTSE